MGGLRVLRKLSAWSRRPLAVVVSGEKAQSYPITATLTYKVFGYLPKQHFDVRNYSRLITAACLYQDAHDIIALVAAFDCDPDNLEFAKRCWVFAKEILAADTPAGINALPVNFPENLDHQIEATIAELDRTTGRPTSAAIRHTLRLRVVGKYEWTILRAYLADFGNFRDLYPADVDALRHIAASAVKHAIQRANQTNAFVGVLSPEHSPDPCFMIIMGSVSNLDLQAIKRNIEDFYHENNVAVLPYDARNAFFQRLKDEGRIVPSNRDEQNKLLQKLMPQMQYMVWQSDSDEEAPLFTDVEQAMDVLAKLPPVEGRPRRREPM